MATQDQGQHNVNIEIDRDEVLDDGDSAIGGSLASSTTSLSSSIMAYRQENGRTYHAYNDGAYVLPNDEGENDRLDLQNHMFALTLDGKLCLAQFPKGKPRHVLDVGCGTGIWAIDFADEHPEAEVIGVDLSPIQPTFVPPNLKFEIDDVEATWTYGKKFDYIHGRALMASFADYPKFFKQCYDNLEPGGILEMQDITFPLRCDDDSYPPTSALATWVHLMTKGGNALGRPLEGAQHYQRQMREAGFVEITEEQWKWPQNPWPKDKKLKELGVWARENVLGGLEGLSLALLTRGCRMSAEEVLVFLTEVRKDVRDTKMHVYWPVHMVWGRKLLSAS